MANPSNPGDSSQREPSSDSVLLTDLSLDRTQVLAIPLSTAVWELQTYGCLLHARPFGEARADPTAAIMVGHHLETYLMHLEQDTDTPDDPDALDDRDGDGEEVEELRGLDGEDFDAEEFWSGDDNLDWRPEARMTTAAWLASEPTLSQTYARPDPSWGFDYTPAPLIAPSDRDAFERSATSLGYTVLHAPGLEELYLTGPGRGVEAEISLRALTGGV